MFIHYRTQGLILGKEDGGEADRIFTIYTKDFGKLDLLAKAERKIKSKLRAGLELFYLSDIEFIQGKAQKTLTDAILMDSFRGIKNDPEKLAVAYKISEVSDELIKGQEPDKEIWNLLTETFEKLDSHSQSRPLPFAVYYYFLWNFLSALGYQFELYRCVFCREKLSPEDISFSVEDGGLACQKCKGKTEKGEPISPEAVKIIRIILKKDWPSLARLKVGVEDLKLLKKISDNYLSYVLSQIN